jgi:hypothetical protein
LGEKEVIKDDERSESPTTSINNPDVEESSQNVIKYRRLTVRKLAYEINMNRGTGLCLNAYTNMLKNISGTPDMRKKCSDFSGRITEKLRVFQIL